MTRGLFAGIALAAVLASSGFGCAPRGRGSSPDPSPAPSAAARVTPATSSAGDAYDAWVGRYEGVAATALPFFGPGARPRLAFLAVDEPAGTGASDRAASIDGSLLSSDGRVGWLSRTALGAKHGGFGHLGAGEDARLTALLRDLPDDGHALPPPGRRMMVQWFTGGRDGATETRVYDRANAPEAVWEIARVSGAAVRAFVPEHAPQREIAVGGHSHGSAMFLAPDGATLVCADGDRLAFWSVASFEKVGEVKLPRWLAIERVALSPDGRYAAATNGFRPCTVIDTTTWQPVAELEEPVTDRAPAPLGFPQFTPDGRHLLLQRGDDALMAFDVETWQERPALPDELPADCVQYVGAPAGDRSGRRAVALVRDGGLVLWDPVGRRAVAQLDAGETQIDHVAFSPDRTRVAVATRHERQRSGHAVDYWRSRRIRIWRVDDGSLVHELRPFEQQRCETVEGLLWSADGDFVLAATESHPFFTSRGISAWSARTGRHRAELTGCPSEVTGLVLLDGGRTLAAGCIDGVVRVWDLSAVLSDVRDFEEPLGNGLGPRR